MNAEKDEYIKRFLCFPLFYIYMNCEQLRNYIRTKYHIPLEILKSMIIQSRMTDSQILNWHIPALPGGGGSLQPGRAILNREEFETLADVLNSGDPWRIKQALGENGIYIASILRNKPYITVYRASLFPIIPGSYVTESREYAIFHRDYVNAPEYKIYSLTAPPSSLGWCGDTHEFIFIPTIEEWKHIAKMRVSKYPIELQNDVLKC